MIAALRGHHQYTRLDERADRQQAIAKLESFAVKMVIRISGALFTLKIDRNSYTDNLIRAGRLRFTAIWQNGTTVDRSSGA